MVDGEAGRRGGDGEGGIANSFTNRKRNPGQTRDTNSAIHCDVRIRLAGPAGGAEERVGEAGAPTPAFSPWPGTAHCCSHPCDSQTLLKLALRLGLLT